ncbi:MAG: hypothetical protein NC408_08120 [Candidatus Gastranaerophilales bacterium]|nr:hypothetical protein [Candidatus Gastranaerophilales bacterium]MCM1073251.1 hypothetical protein [Bacteroides sp.]
MHLVKSIFNKGLEEAHTYCLRAKVHAEILEDIIKYMEIYPNKNEYIDFAIRYEFKQPIWQLIKMTENKNN